MPPGFSPSSTRSDRHRLYRLQNTRLLAGVLLCGLLLAGCSTAPYTRQLATSQPADLPVRHTIEQVPFFPQTRYQCGPAALATVLATHGIDVTPDTLVDLVYTPALQGSLTEEMTAAARRYGMLAYPLAPSLADMLDEIAHDRPVLVFQNLGLRWLQKLHYAVAVGYDLDANELVLRSGTTRQRRMPLDTFEHTWARGGYRAWVMLPAGEVPHTATPLPYLQAARDLEQTAGPDTAHPAWQAATRKWPQSFHAWMTLGNNRYAVDDFMSAMTAFRQATRIAPDEPAGWNNLAYALLDVHCPQQALQAVHCATRLAPGNEQVLQTAAEIRQRATGTDATHCRAVSCNTGKVQDHSPTP